MDCGLACGGGRAGSRGVPAGFGTWRRLAKHYLGLRLVPTLCRQVEVLFRAKTDRRTRSLVLPQNTNVSVRWAEKGSYREEHLLAYMDQWLEPWTAERQAAQDYRVLMLDVARSHIGEDVLDLAFARGYVPLFHYGCTTAVCQVNDTDCHGAFQRVYVEYEQAAFARTQLYDPGNIGRTPQQLLDDVVATWRSLDHMGGVAGHKRNALSVALDGSEDHLISREARRLWFDAGMPEHRQTAIAEVDRLVATGQLSSAADWRKVVRHPNSPGVLQHEGDELEGDLDVGENPWLDDADVSMQAADAKDAEAAEDIAEASVLAVAATSDSKEEVEEAVGAARRLQLLKRLRASAVEARVPAAANAVRVQIDHVERGLRSTSAEEKTANAVLRRHLEAVRAEEVATVAKKQEESRKKRRNLLMVKKKVAAAKKRAVAKARLRATAKAMAAKVPKMFTVEDVGPLGPKGDKARKELLDRLKDIAPALTVAQRVKWPTVRDGFVKQHMIKWGSNGGDVFLKDVNQVLAALKTQRESAGTSLPGRPAAKEPTAFAEFFNKMERFVQKPSVHVVL